MRRRTQTAPASIPLNCVDKCLLAVDGINEPMLIHTVLSVQGAIDGDRLSGAILSAQQAHPVMRTLLRSRRLRPFRQIQEALDKGILTVADQAQLRNTDCETYLSSWMNKPLDVRKEFPLRVLLLRTSETGSFLVFTFHHSSTDGLRAFLFLRNVIENYNNRLLEEDGGVPSSRQAPIDIRLSRGGDELLAYANSQRSKVQRYYRKVAYSLIHRFVLSAPFPPTRVFHDRSGRSRELRYCFGALDPDGFEQVQTKARSAGVTVNDLLLAACYRTVDKWNSMHGKASKRIRIMAPVNISPKGFRDVVSNQASWLSLTMTPRDRADAVELLRKVRAATIDATMNRAAFSLIYFFYFCSRFPLFAMRWMCRFLLITRTYVDTILVTNVGHIWPRPDSEKAAVNTIGDARILNLTGSAPVVSPMGLSIGAGTYNGNMNLSLTYRPALFSEEKARMFLSLYVEEIKNYPVGAQDA